MMFALPAWTLGLILALVIFGVAVSYLSKLSSINMSPYLSPTGILVATALGLLIPIVSAIVPIRVRGHEHRILLSVPRCQPLGISARTGVARGVPGGAGFLAHRTPSTKTSTTRST